MPGEPNASGLWRDSDRSAVLHTKMDLSNDSERQCLVAQQQRKVQSPPFALVVMRKDEVKVGSSVISTRRRFPVASMNPFRGFLEN